MSNNGVQQQQQQQQQQQFLQNTPYHCKECGISLNSAESLDVHLQYHKENLLKHWAIQAATQSEETNNNNNTTKNIKREFVAADSSDSMHLMQKKSPSTSNNTSELFGHPPTPQSYQSASSSSPYHQNADYYQSGIKTDRNSPQYQGYYNNTEYYIESNQFNQEYKYRYHPYSGGYDRGVSSSSPAYPPQPTPSPSPKQCEKCGYVCESAAQLIEHLNIAHPYQNYYEPVQIKQESEILDLDSHKVVHNVYQTQPQPQSQTQEDDVSKWSFHNDYVNVNNSVTTTTNTTVAQDLPTIPYRPFDVASTPVITSTQVSNPVAPAAAPVKGSNWKSNEARRPKTYNCTACNKWFTSSGHLKRHYNTTLHKNAVKSSGQPDPASLPISAHHHPARDNNTSKLEERPQSGSSGDDYQDSNHFEQSPPNGEAGLSTTTAPITEARGLQMHHGTNAMTQYNFQMYPNELAPHVTQQIMDISTIGDYLPVAESQNQPLPSFAQIQAHKFALFEAKEVSVFEPDADKANVGGRGPATAPYSYFNQPPEIKSYTYTDLTEEDDIKQQLEAQPKSPEKAHIKRDYEENHPVITSTSTTKSGVHKCYDCDKIFNKACYLTQHNKTFHSGDKPFKCTRCGKRFSCDVTYQEHLSKHAGEKPHKCELCPKQFNHKTDLRRHMCLHTGQKPYACETCGKGFIRKDHMMKHCETHMRKTQGKITTIR